MEGDFGIVYLIETPQQFWSELDEILPLPVDPTLSHLDSTLRRFISLCATYHEQYLQSTMQLEHACENLLQSELFAFHSERMCELLADDARTTTDPHTQLIIYNICLLRGRQNSNFLRSHKRWQPLIPLLIDHILVDVDPDVQETYTGHSAGSGGSFSRGVSIPIEAKIRSLSMRLLYEVCRVQKLSFSDLRVFEDSFIDHLFDLVEQTRNMHDESFNYSVIKLIVALNEQFMVASIPPAAGTKPHKEHPDKQVQVENRVLAVLMRRLGSSQTFGENLIFMLNRAGRTPEDLCMQLLVLKMLYILFTSKGTSEYFYTNDMCVLVDVFLREVVDLDEESESLRHTYLRVLHPLLTKTQLRALPYKRPQIVRALESLVANANIRDVNPTTKRLVDRCLGGEWCVQFRKAHPSTYSPAPEISRIASPGPTTASSNLLAPTGHKHKSLKSSKSVENMKKVPLSERDKMALRKASNDSSTSLPNVAAASTSGSISRRRDRTGSFNVDMPTQDFTPARADSMGIIDGMISPTETSQSFASVPATPTMTSSPTFSLPSPSGRRSAPPAPPKRRKPPAIPVKATPRTAAGVTMTTIASTSSPLSQQAGYRG